MDEQSTFLLALGLVVAAGLAVSAAGWVLFVRDRRDVRAELSAADAPHHEVAEER